MHFEIQADNVERAAKFYREVFGWTIEKWPNPGMEYWMVMTAEKDSKEPGINGGLLQRAGKLSDTERGVNAFVCTVVVDDFDAIAKKILAAGGKNVVPKIALMGMAWQGYFLDTERNVFGLHQVDKNAK